MKNLVIFILSFFVCPYVFPQDMISNEEMPENEKSTDQLYAMGVQLVFDEDGNLEPIPGSPEILAFTGDDIQSFNMTTREIVFTTDSIHIYEYGTRFNGITIYFNNTPILANVALTSAASSFSINDLVLYCEFNAIRKYSFYLYNGYPDMPVWPDKESAQKERDTNTEKRKAGWDIFIKYLNDNGKIVENTGIEDVKTALPIQIYSVRKTIHVNNQTGKKGMVTVYRIDGVKVAEQTVSGQTTTLEMSVSGSYLVSVKVGNEKPVIEKLFVN